MSNLTARVMRMFNGPARVRDYEGITVPPPEDGVQGDWARLHSVSGLAVFGPKIDDATWPAAAINQGPAGPQASPTDRGVWAASTAYAANDSVFARGLRWLRLTAGTSGTQFNATNWLPLGARPGPAGPRSGEYLQPQCVNAIQTNQALVDAQLSSIPIEIGPAGMSVNAIAMVESTTIQVGGATTMSLAVYPDDGTTGTQPDWSTGPIISGTVDLTSGSGQKLTTGLTATLGPGIYHLVALYVVTTAPTTAPAATMVNGTVGLPSATVVGVPRGYTYGTPSGTPTPRVTALPNGSGPTLVPNVAATIPAMALRSA